MNKLIIPMNYLINYDKFVRLGKVEQNRTATQIINLARILSDGALKNGFLINYPCVLEFDWFFGKKLDYNGYNISFSKTFILKGMENARYKNIRLLESTKVRCVTATVDKFYKAFDKPRVEIFTRTDIKF